jgi:hypothetical protein
MTHKAVRKWAYRCAKGRMGIQLPVYGLGIDTILAMKTKNRWESTHRIYSKSSSLIPPTRTIFFGGIRPMTPAECF